MVDMNDEELSNLILKLKKESEKCNTIEEYLNMICNFQYNEISFYPGQIINEIYILLMILSKQLPKVLVEIGTGRGGTLFLLSKVAAKNAEIISIDLPDGKFGGEFPLWKNQIYTSFATDKQQIHIIRTASQDDSTLLELKLVGVGNILTGIYALLFGILIALVMMPMKLGKIIKGE